MSCLLMFVWSCLVHNRYVTFKLSEGLPVISAKTCWDGLEALSGHFGESS